MRRAADIDVKLFLTSMSNLVGVAWRANSCRVDHDWMDVTANMRLARPEDRLFRLSIGLFFIGGFLTSIVSLLVPRMKLLFGLDYARAMLVQLVFHSSYLLFAFPAAAIIRRLGYMRSIVFGVTVMALACSAFLVAEGRSSYPAVLASLLLLSIGISVLQISGNTVVTVVGGAERAASRLTLLQGFNAFGTVAGPLLCAQFLLTNISRSGAEEAWRLAAPFLFSIALLLALACAYAANRNMLERPDDTSASWWADYVALLRRPRAIASIGAIFAYVGAEVTIGSVLVLFLMSPRILSTDAVAAGRLVGLYWGGAMVGRLAGAFLLRRIRETTLLGGACVAAVVMVTLAIVGTGKLAAVALILVGLCNSIMYPTVFALALPRESFLATPMATLLCLAVVGGAIVPWCTGVIADWAGLRTALALPAACYVGVLSFAMLRRREGASA
jgi:MFS transporter, FHS family, L-fucose permease